MNWGSISLGELTANTRPICYGVLKPGEYVESGIPLIRTCDISSNYFDGTNLHRISQQLDSEFKRSRIIGGELLISLQGTVGRVAIYPPEYGCANISRTIGVIEPDKRINKKFLYWYLRHLGSKDGFHTVGSTRSSLNIEHLRKVLIPLPTLSEQEQIAEVLDKADTLRQKRRFALQKLDILLQSVFLEMFGNPVKNPKGLEKVPLGKYVKVQGGFAFKSEDYLDEGIKLVKISNVHFETLTWDDINFLPNSYLQTYKDFALKEKDIVLSLTRPIIKSLNNVKIAQISVNDLPCLLNQRVGRFVIKNSDFIDETYLIHFCYSTYFKNEIIRYSSESLQPNVSPKQIEEILITLPPISEQLKFAQLVEKIQKIKKTVKNSLIYSQSLFQALQQRAFKGELFNDKFLTEENGENLWHQTSLF